MDDLNQSLASDLNGTFPLVVETMGGRIYSALRRMSRSHQEAEDLTQETMIRAYRALETYDTQRICDLRIEGWLWTIALNIGRNHLRDKERRPTVAPDVDQVVVDPDPVDSAAWDRRLSRLPLSQRRAVVLRHVVGLSVKEISEATLRPEGTIKADIHRGLARLRAIMEAEQ